MIVPAALNVDYLCPKCDTELTTHTTAELTAANNFRDEVVEQKIKCPHCLAELVRPKLVMSYMIDRAAT
jgi:DNA-directed RNA polymerase subunit RPC12/RpoP